MTHSISEKIAALPPEWPHELSVENRNRLLTSNRKLVVLDDDPTGSQTVYDVPVVTEWSVATLRKLLQEDAPLFFVLTNSRSLPEAEAVALAQEIGNNLKSAANELGCSFELISRSDSTLRGHFPAEVDAVAAATEQTDAVRLIVPFFAEGGRLTFDDVHYVMEGKSVIPASETPFARDASFGFSHSNLKQWVAEKSGGQLSATDVFSVSLEALRTEGPERVAQMLTALPAGATCVVNAVSLRDVEVLASAMERAAQAGGEFISRAAASLVQARAGLSTQPLLTAERVVNSHAKAGLIVVGSYVPKTTAQLEHLQDQHSAHLFPVEIPVTQLLDESFSGKVVEEARQNVIRHLNMGRDVLLSTSRELVRDPQDCGNLHFGKQVSAALVQIVSSLGHTLRFLIAKGGITSSDIATQALHVRRATILGQLLPGVPVWRLGEESRYPGMGYVIFPGNVGQESSLSTAYETLRRQSATSEPNA